MNTKNRNKIWIYAILLLILSHAGISHAGYAVQINAEKITDGTINDGKWHLIGSWNRPLIENALVAGYGERATPGICTVIKGKGITRFSISGILGNQVSVIDLWGDPLPERTEPVWVKMEGDESYDGTEIVANCDFKVYDMSNVLIDAFNLQITIASLGPSGSCSITLPGTLSIPVINSSAIKKASVGDKLTAYSINISPTIDCAGNISSGIGFRFTPTFLNDGCIGTNMTALSICISLDGKEIVMNSDVNQVFNAGINTLLTFTPKIMAKEVEPGEYNGVLTITINVL